MKKHTLRLHILVTLLIFAISISLAACFEVDNAPDSSEPTDTPTESPSESKSDIPATPTDPEETDPEPTGTEPEETAPEEQKPEPTGTEPEETAPEEQKPEPFTLKIGSFNIANGTNVRHSMKHLGEDIKAAGLDIVGLQEVDQFVPRSKNQDSIKLISEYSGLPYYAFFKAIDLNGGEYGVAILSRYPIIETFSQLLYSGTEEQRVAGCAKIDVNGTIINFLSTHLSYESKSLRTKQFAQLAEITANMDNFIITGDFNTNNFAEYAPIKNADMVNNTKYSIYTFPSTGPSSSIDNIVYSTGNWTFENPEIVLNKHSDHCMLYAVGTFTPSTEE